jgi:hypothetical protein
MNAKDFRGPLLLVFADLRAAALGARSHDQHHYPAAGPGAPAEGPPAAELDVVGMGADGENGWFFKRHKGSGGQMKIIHAVQVIIILFNHVLNPRSIKKP